MPKNKIFYTILLFSILMVITSVIKTKTRIIEKQISKLEKNIFIKKKNLHEIQIDFYYLSSPRNISKKLTNFDDLNYKPMKHSNIYLSFEDYLKDQTKITFSKKTNEKKIQKK
tara:strand:+ start:2356 stop:2694 length:339 start_codon:yes stop_codon:yes gene_type:complete